MGSKMLVMLVSLPCQEIESAWLARDFGTFLFVSFLIQQLILQGAMCNQEWPAGLVMARYPFFVHSWIPLYAQPMVLYAHHQSGISSMDQCCMCASLGGWVCWPA